MKKTSILLFVFLLFIPILGFYLSEPLTDLQLEAVFKTVAICLSVAFLCFVVSEITKNYSQVDKLWSIIPIVYAWVMTSVGGFSERLILMASLVTIWGIRLTLNFARRGGYSWKFWEGVEDYRWSILREKLNFKHPRSWCVFNLVFISLYQMGLILIMTYPMILAIGSNEPLGILDIGVAVLMLGFITYETIADNQQWNFQLEKRMFIRNTGKSAKEFEDGFNQRGLWSLSRHPNYFAEQSIWVTFYLFSIIATGEWLNWTITGAVLIILLFQGSSTLSEKITSGKYPKYSDHQKRIPKFIPSLFKAS